MSLEICKDDPFSPRNALIAIAVLAFTVYLFSFFLLFEGLLCILLRNITSVPCNFHGSAALFQYVFLISSLLQHLANRAGIKFEYFFALVSIMCSL